MEQYLIAIIMGVLAGSAGRWYMLQVDFRQYPSYPHGAVIHLALGFIAAVMGAVALPALIDKEYTAVTFLALAATQFRDVRDIERKTLLSLDESELVPRGGDYIEGIARVFEARNYIVMMTGILVSGIAYYGGFIAGLIVTLPVIYAGSMLMRGKQLGDIAKIRTGKVRFEQANVFVEDIHFMNLGTKETRDTVLERGVGLVIEPYNDDARETLANNGQRMAIAHDVAVQLGVYRDVDTAEYMPLVRRDLDTGRVGLLILPLEKDEECIIEAAKRVPVLESAVTRPLLSKPGKKAAD